MALEQKMMLKINVIDKESEQALFALSREKDILEDKLQRTKEQITKLLGFRDAVEEFNKIYNEVTSEPDTVRKYEGMK